MFIIVLIIIILIIYNIKHNIISMGNTGIRKIWMAGDYCETSHKSLFDLQVDTLDRTLQPLLTY